MLYVRLLLYLSLTFHKGATVAHATAKNPKWVKKLDQDHTSMVISGSEDLFHQTSQINTNEALWIHKLAMSNCAGVSLEYCLFHGRK